MFPAASRRLSSAAPASGRPKRLALLLIVALALPAWLVLAWWGTSPYRRYVDDGGYADPSWFAALCAVVPAGGIALPALIHAASWLAMIAAMMLPTVWPLLRLFERLVAPRKDAGALLACVIAGYFAAWLGFGFVAHTADAMVRGVVARSGWLMNHAWLIGTLVLAGAGAFQWSRLKYHCLDKCRTPLGFVMQRWHGRRPVREAWHLGFDHGLFCVGCCWALMLVMFVVGMGNAGWMLALAAVMAAEKNLRWGARLRTPVGVGLLACAVGLAVTQSWG
jgi:predicted metal-binding membrane protein